MAKAASLGLRRLAFLFKLKRAEQGWSQRELGKRLNTSQSNIVKIENLQGGTCGFDIVEAAVKVFRIEPGYFFAAGRDELDPAGYDVPTRRAVEDRLDAIEEQLKDSDSGPRTIRNRKR